MRGIRMQDSSRPLKQKSTKIEALSLYKLVLSAQNLSTCEIWVKGLKLIRNMLILVFLKE